MTKSIPDRADVRKKLREALNKSYSKGKFSSKRLFSEWFCKKGTPYFFLFKKNLSHTSMQYAEIIPLIREHTMGESGAGKKLQFLKLQEFVDNWYRLFNDIEKTKLGQEKKLIVDKIIELYGIALCSTVVMESFFCSCTIYIPHPLKLNLFKICGESGYIHSCGLNVYTRSLDETDPDDLINEIKTHSEQNTSQGTTKNLVVYCHEDFKDNDRKYKKYKAEELRDGLNDIKIYVEKYYLGDMSFVSFLGELKGKFGGKVLLQESEDLIRQHKAALENHIHETEGTLWLIVDRSLNLKNRRFPGNERFIICYDQQYKNCNPFHIFDENKPAWVSHTTIPHKLAGAMINITRPWWPKNSDGKVKIADPFSGSGTIALECLKFSNVKVDCSDSDPICERLVKDNLDFFASENDDIQKYIQYLNELIKGDKRFDKEYPLNIAYKWADEISEEYNTFLREKKTLIKEELKEKLKEKLNKQKDFFYRLLFYLLRRVQIRHAVALERATESLNQATINEFERLRDQFEELIWQKKMHLVKTTKEEGSGTLIKFMGIYSLCVSIDSIVFEEAAEHIKVTTRNASESISSKNGKVDVIVTDPPYGFNTDENYVNLASTYTCALKLMISRLNDGGQLVICLPDKSFTGRKISAFSTSDWLIQQILVEAKAVGFEAITEAQVLPRPTNMFRPPYYWESERALRRNILHFRFREIKGLKEKGTDTVLFNK